MRIEDIVYGSEEIQEPVLVELISSGPVQRLKGLHQYGMPDEYYRRDKPNFSRYDHSIGVMILLKRLGANLEEQVAGLLHDVSHYTFSHVVDWMFGDPTKEDFQDRNHSPFIKNSVIPLILEYYKFDHQKVSSHHSFSLLDREIPNLCADRVDYALRELATDGISVRDFVDNLRNKEGRMVFGDIRIADTFAREFLRLNHDHWGGADARMRYSILSEVLKKAVTLGVLSVKDFLRTDYEVIALLRNSDDSFIQENLNLLREGFRVEEVSEGGILLPKKFRYVDPLVSSNGSVQRLSEISPDFSVFIEQEKEKATIKRRYVLCPVV